MKKKMQFIENIIGGAAIVSSLIIYSVEGKDSSEVIEDIVFGIVLCLISFLVFSFFFKFIRKALKESVFRTITTVFSICMLISILFLWAGMLVFPAEEAIINNQFMIVGAYLGCKTSRSFLDNGRA